MRVWLVIRSDPGQVSNILSWLFDHEIFSTVILSLPLIQEGQLSVSGERGLSLPSKIVVRQIDGAWHDTIELTGSHWVDWAVKP